MSCCAVQELMNNAPVLQGLVGRREWPETGLAPNKKTRTRPVEDALKGPLAQRPSNHISEPDEEEILVAETMAMLSAQQTAAEACHSAAAVAPGEYDEVCKHESQLRYCMQFECCNIKCFRLYNPAMIIFSDRLFCRLQ